MPVDLKDFSIANNRCPRCCRSFRNLRAVRNHLNQPHSQCRHRYELRIGKCLRPVLFKDASLPPLRRHTSPPGDFPDSQVPNDSDNLDEAAEAMDVADSSHEADSPTSLTPSEPQPPPLLHEQPFYREDFIGAAVTHGLGATIMDRLREDEHFEKRKRNPFYPYADRSEFQIANWISNSRLSMAEQDEFFHLTRVSNTPCPFKHKLTNNH